jgi:hypothetical protein
LMLAQDCPRFRREDRRLMALSDGRIKLFPFSLRRNRIGCKRRPHMTAGRQGAKRRLVSPERTRGLYFDARRSAQTLLH